MQATNRFARPISRSIRLASSVPPTVPTASAVVSRPSPTPSSPSGPGATTYRTRTANTAVDARFIGPTTKAIVRSSRWCQRYDIPTRISDAIDAGGPVAHGPERAGQRDEAEQRAEIAGGRRPERRRDRDPGEEPAERRPDEVVHRQLDRVQPAVRGDDLVLADDVREHRARGRVEHRLEAAEHERDDVEQPDRGDVGDDRDGQPAEQDDPAGVDEDHRPAPVEPIRERAGDQGEHEPRQARRDRDAGDEPRLLRHADREQRQRDLEDPVGQVGQERGREQRPEPPPQPVIERRHERSALRRTVALGQREPSGTGPTISKASRRASPRRRTSPPPAVRVIGVAPPDRCRRPGSRRRGAGRSRA